MKKLMSACTTLALVAMVFGPAIALAGVTTGNTTGNVTTGLTQDTSGGKNPIVKAKWEANGTSTNPVDYYTDDSPAAGAQFNPSGLYQVNKKIALCSVVTDPDGLADITTPPGAVYSDVFYPDNIALGTSHVPLTNQSNLGCGGLMQEDQAKILTKAQGLALFCNNVRNNNNNLPTFQTPSTTYNYDEICKADGELQKETAAVYCVTKDLSYEDPAGDYKVWAVAQDKVGLQGKLENYFTYEPVTAFETDFTAINYANVRLNTDKIVPGDLIWNTLNAGPASVRNIGNTRVQISVNQDDMGFSKTGSSWNVKYDARVGSDAPWAYYDPNVPTALDKSLDLSQLNEMDFSILVSKFPPTHTGPYSGTMTLTGGAVDQLVCKPLD